MKRFVVIVLLSFWCGAVVAQNDAVIDRIIELGRSDNRVMEHLDVLSNRFGGRLVGSNAYDNAVQWCASKFEEWGLEVVIDEAGEMPVGFNRGPWFGRMLSEDGMVLHFATPSYSAGTRGVQRGHVLMEPKSREEFDRMKGALEGAWVLITDDNNGWAIDRSASGDEYRARIITENEKAAALNREVAIWNREHPDSPKELHKMQDAPALFYREMVDAGIIGIIQSSPVPIRALYDRAMLDMTFETLPEVPDIKLDRKQYAIIEEKVRERRYFELEFDIRNHFRMGPVKYHNVLGIIRGSEFPDEYVMVGGHLDAFDVATGAVDCGSGTTPVMEAARLIVESGGRPRRSIVFCLWAAEEFGLWGSKHWVENNEDKWPYISNYFNRDSGPLAPTGITVPEAMYDDMSKVCAPLNSVNPDLPFVVSRRTEPLAIPQSAGGSDHAWFVRNRIPAIAFSLSDPLGYNFDYQEIWHTERDTYDKAIAEYQEHAAIVTAVVAYGVADLDGLLSREGLYKTEK